MAGNQPKHDRSDALKSPFVMLPARARGRMEAERRAGRPTEKVSSLPAASGSGIKRSKGKRRSAKPSEARTTARVAGEPRRSEKRGPGRASAGRRAGREEAARRSKPGEAQTKRRKPKQATNFGRVESTPRAKLTKALVFRALLSAAPWPPLAFVSCLGRVTTARARRRRADEEISTLLVRFCLTNLDGWGYKSRPGQRP